VARPRQRAVVGVSVPQGLVAHLKALAVQPEVVGPHARLGLVWAAVTLVALFAGPVWLAVWLAPVAGVAAIQAAASWRRRSRSPAAVLAGVGAALITLAAAAGPLVAAVAVTAVGVAAFANALVPGGRHSDPALTLAITGALGLAGAAPVLVRGDGLIPALVLLTFASVHDAGAYVVGSGAATAWEGPAAGMASIGAVTLAVAAVFVPPFRGASPWLLGALAAGLAALGPYLGSALLGDRRARVPALRRMDSLLLLGPLWALAAAALI
jgi:hypothetical protein